MTLNLPESGSSRRSFSRGKAGRNASGNLRKILYMTKMDFFLRYGLLELISDNTSLAKSLQARIHKITERLPINHCFTVPGKVRGHEAS